ncbi:MAG: S9 family peptidase [Symbiobacteriaceae bacterium]|nr:S9 family peptidase [Symbiobacteriaceae bacterium]
MRNMAVQDILAFQWVVDPNLSPDGKNVAFTQTIIDAESKEYRHHLYLVPSCGSTPPRKISNAPRRDTTPRWSPCGNQLAFVSDRSGEGQIWLLEMSGGEATQLTTMRYGAGNPIWSPDGTKIAFSSSMHPSDTLEQMFKPLSREERDKDAKYKREHGLVVEKLQYRSDDSGFSTGRYNHIWVIDLASKEIKQLTSGSWNHAAYSWSPCSSKLVFAANRTPNPEEETWNSDLWIVPAGGGELQQLTHTDGPCSAPAWSPDGKTIAYLGHLREFSGATLTRIWTVPATGGESQCLTTAYDQGFGSGPTSDMTRSGGSSRSLVWSADSSKIYALSNLHGNTHLYSITVDGVAKPLSTGNRAIYGWSMGSSDQQVAIAWCNLLEPNEIALLDLNSGAEKPLTQVNSWLKEVNLRDAEMFWCKGDEDWDLQGWLMKPIGWEAGQKYPLVLSVHGGPSQMYGFAFNHLFQTLCGEGYYVLYLNPRGGEGYGQKFLHGVNCKYGEGDYRDLMLALDYCIAHHPEIDTANLGVTGASYGGFMTNWIVGQTDRFKAAITQASISNWVTFFGTSDIGFNFCDNQHGANPLTDFDEMVKRSPLTYVKNVTTPLLIIHNEQDYRCPIEQGEQLFVSLKKLGKTVKMVRFNNANHGMSGSGVPALRVDRVNHILAWFNEYMKPQKAE